MNRFGLKPPEADQAPRRETSVQQASLGSEMIDSEIWPWVAALVLAALLIEGLVANRTTA